MIEKKIMKYTLNPLINFIGRKIEKKRFDEDPILIVASPRSGTTMLLSILSAHPNIFAIKRQTYAFHKWTEDKGQLKNLRIDRLYREFIRQRIKKSAHRWCEKTPRHIQDLKEIIQTYPNYKIIHLVRDGRDVVTSRHPLHNPESYWVKIDKWAEEVNYALSFQDYKNLYLIRYEDILNNYESEIKKLLNFLEEDYLPEMEKWFENSKLRNSKHWKSGIQKLHTKSVGRWKKPEHKERIDKFMKNKKAVDLMIRLNYLR